MNKNAQKLGALGGQKTAKLYGKDHFSQAGKKGMEKRWDTGWICTRCKAEYAEYVNGCPKCATGKVGGSAKVIRSIT